MGLIFSRRVGSDPFYLSYEKSFEKIASKETAVQARRFRRRKALNAYIEWGRFLSILWGVVAAVLWGGAQKAGDVSKQLGRYYYAAILGTIAVPGLLILMSLVLGKVLDMLDRRDATYIKNLGDSRKKMLKEIKDSTHFEKTLELLKKYDPEARTPPKPPTPKPGTTPGRAGPLTPASQILTKTGNMAAAAAAGAGKALFPVFDSLANNMIGDNPALVEELRRAQERAAHLEKENELLRAQLAQLDIAPAPLLVLSPVSSLGEGTTSAPGAAANVATAGAPQPAKAPSGMEAVPEQQISLKPHKRPDTEDLKFPAPTLLPRIPGSTGTALAGKGAGADAGGEDRSSGDKLAVSGGAGKS